MIKLFEKHLKKKESTLSYLYYYKNNSFSALLQKILNQSTFKIHRKQTWHIIKYKYQAFPFISRVCGFSMKNRPKSEIRTYVKK